MTAPTCPIHPTTRLTCPSCTAARTRGRSSAKKAKSSARNAERARAVREAKRALPDIRRVLADHAARVIRGGGGPACKCESCVQGRIILAELATATKRKPAM